MKRLVAAALIFALASCGEAEERDLPVAGIDCRVGLYQDQGGESFVLTPVSSGGYRWRFLDGRTGVLTQSEGAWTSTLGLTTEVDGMTADLGACGDDAVQFGPEGALVRYERVPLRITDTTFEHDGLSFAGRLVWPADGAPTALVVHTHGSESWSAVRSGSMHFMLAAQGIASFVYDKRGTGQTGGEYTQDFHVLAGDAIAALSEARRLAGDRATRTGFLGASQGGWIAPLAASQSDVDFVVALYGLAVNALQEDRYEIVQSLARAGWGEAEQAKGAALSDAAGEIMRSDFRSGFSEFNRLRREYRNEPWFDDMEGEFTTDMLPYPEIGLRLVGPMRDQGTSWEYEPAPVLRALDIPQFWMIAADDTEAPPEETIARLRALQAEGRPIDLVIYPGADHGMILTERGADGGARQTGFVQNYYRQVGAWILARDLTFAREAGADVHPAQGQTPPQP